MRNDCVQNLKSISQMVIELWLIKICLIFECNDLKFYFRFNTLNSKAGYTRYISLMLYHTVKGFLALRSCEIIACAHPHLLRFHANDYHQLTVSKQLFCICIILELKRYKFRQHVTNVFYKLKSSLTKRA